MDLSPANPGTSAIADDVRALIVELARNDSNWGYTSIRDRLENLGHRVSSLDSCECIEGARHRPGAHTWSADVVGYLRESALAKSGGIDFTTVEVLTKGGLVKHYVLFVMELATKKVMCAGITPHSDAAWILKTGRNLTDAFSGFLRGKRFVIMDRDTSFHAAFRGLLEGSGVWTVRHPGSLAQLQRSSRTLPPLI